MPKEKKEDKKPSKRGKYEEKLTVDASFMDIVKASVKDAEKKDKKKKK